MPPNIIMTPTFLNFLWKWCAKKKLIDQRVHISDIAPTLSIIMKTSFPSGCTGNPIEDVISEN